MDTSFTFLTQTNTFNFVAKRISSQLQICKENGISLEGICDALRQELEELQQQCYQKQLQTQRQQRRKQQQPQKQQPQQRKQEKWQGQQCREQNQMLESDKKLGSFEHTSNTQDKRIQRPLFVSRSPVAYSTSALHKLTVCTL